MTTPLGMRLCERGRAGFSLTEQGKLVHSAAFQLIGEMERFADYVGTTSRVLSD